MCSKACSQLPKSLVGWHKGACWFPAANPALKVVSLCHPGWGGGEGGGGQNRSGERKFWGILECRSEREKGGTSCNSTGLILIPNPSPTSISWVIWICTHEIADTDLNSPIGLAGVWHGVEGQISLIPSCAHTSPHLHCATCVRTQVRIASWVFQLLLNICPSHKHQMFCAWPWIYPVRHQYWPPCYATRLYFCMLQKYIIPCQSWGVTKVIQITLWLSGLLGGLGEKCRNVFFFSFIQSMGRDKREQVFLVQ